MVAGTVVTEWISAFSSCVGAIATAYLAGQAAYKKISFLVI